MTLLEEIKYTKTFCKKWDDEYGCEYCPRENLCLKAEKVYPGLLPSEWTDEQMEELTEKL